MCFGNLETTGQTNSVNNSNTVASTNTARATDIDPTLRDFGTSSINYLTNLRDSGYQGYPDMTALVAPLSNYSGEAGAQLEGMAASSMDPMLGTASSYYRYAGDAPAQSVGQNSTPYYYEYANAGPQSVGQDSRAMYMAAGNGGTSSIRNPGTVINDRRLGSIQSYMDPYLQEVLTPQLQDIQEQGYRDLHHNNAMAAMAGAFGDTGWGQEEARLRDLNQRTRAATIGNAESQAFNNAMGLRSSDLSRMTDVDIRNAAERDAALARQMQAGQGLAGLETTNAGLQEQRLQRLLQGGQAIGGVEAQNAALQEQHLQRMQQAGDALTRLGVMNTQNRLSILNALDQAGRAQQSNDQASADAAYREFSRQTGYPLEVSQMLVSAINGSPLTRASTQVGASNTTANTAGTQTGTTQAPNNSGFQLLGTLLGGLL